jgi:hypothetical protein
MENITKARNEAVRQLREAVAKFKSEVTPEHLRGHRLDEHAQGVLDRLSKAGCGHPWPAEAIIEAVPCERLPWFFADCIYAERLARTHASTVSDAQGIVSRSEDADKALNQIMQFLGRPLRSDSKTVALVYDPEGDAISFIRQMIESKRRGAEITIERSSRKKIEAAGRAAGIGFIADSLADECTPLRLAAIANAVFETDEITPDAARKAPSYVQRVRGAFKG